MKTNHRFPDFLCIGAQKAGTTWLYENLKKHPDIGLPNVKELHYFNAREKALIKKPIERLIHPNSLGIAVQKSLKKWRIKTLITEVLSNLYSGNLIDLFSYSHDFFNFSNDRLYSSVFSSMSEEITGEIAPEYGVISKDSIAHIYQLMPRTKIIFILRNPIDRAWSAARMNLSITTKDFASLSHEDFINNFDSQVSRKRSNYLKIIETWQCYYPEKQFLICFFDELAKKPQQFIHRICEFLNVETDSDYMQQINTKATNSYAENYKNKISPELKIYLAKLYYPELEQLSARFGGYATQWLDSANKLLS
ncbi:MAG: sulfotransferase [Rivularia sp. (in: cyanobacteria)]